MSQPVLHGPSGDGSSVEDPPSGPAPGVAEERVHPRTLQLIEELFPGHHGLDFLARLLRLAREKQLALPDLGLTEVSDVAVITIKSLRVLAQLLDLSYDTTEKYIVLLCQLRLLSKERSRQHITLHFPLSAPQLPNPDALDQLLALRPGSQTPRYREKVRSFASSVKRRFVVFLHEQERIGETSEKKSSAASPGLRLTTRELRLLVEDINQIVQQEVDSEIHSRLMMRIEGTLRYRCTLEPGHLSAPKDDFEGERDTNAILPHEQKSPLSSKNGDSGSSTRALPLQQSRLSPKNGDSFIGAVQQQRRLREPKGDSETPISGQESPISSQKVDSDQHQIAQIGRLSASTQHTEHEIGDSKAREKALNVNVNNILNKINVNVEEVAIYLCHLFKERSEGEDNKKGYYKNLYEKRECHNTQMWLAALIEAAQSTLRPPAPGKKENPGGYFYKRCIQLHQHGIPSRTLQLVQRVQQDGTFTYRQLLELLKQDSATRSLPPSPQEQGSRPRPPSTTITPAVAFPPKGQHGMTREAYNQLVQQIKSAENTKHMRSAYYPRGDGSRLALIEDWFGNQRWISSLEEWHEYASQIRGSAWPKERGNT